MSVPETDTERFLSALVHDLRNFLEGIHATLFQSPELDPELRDVTEREIHELIRKAECHLDQKRLAADSLRLEEAAIPLLPQLRTGVERLQPFLRSRRIAWGTGANPVVILDRGSLRRALASILLAAARLSGEGDPISIDVRSSGRRAVLSVTVPERPDSMEISEYLFSPSESSGVGLGIAGEMIRRQGGDLRREMGGPSVRLVLELPLENTEEDQASSEEAESAAAPAPSRTSLNILVVDDRLDSAKSLAILLSMAGHETDVRHDGRSALEAIRRRRPDVVLLDIGLPDIDGFDVCRVLRETPELRDLTLVAVSGRSDDRAMELTRKAGFDAHLLKPINHGELSALLERVSTRTPRDASS